MLPLVSSPAARSASSLPAAHAPCAHSRSARAAPRSWRPRSVCACHASRAQPNSASASGSGQEASSCAAGRAGVPEGMRQACTGLQASYYHNACTWVSLAAFCRKDYSNCATLVLQRLGRASAALLRRSWAAGLLHADGRAAAAALVLASCAWLSTVDGASAADLAHGHPAFRPLAADLNQLAAGVRRPPTSSARRVAPCAFEGAHWRCGWSACAAAAA
jgi:hypothetical protein